MPTDDRTYDTRQIEAPLMTCLKCGRQYYSALARRICLDCQPWVFKRSDSRLDVSGVLIDGP